MLSMGDSFYMLENRKEYLENTPRRSGKTKGALLEVLGKAMQNPGIEYPVVDHYEHHNWSYLYMDLVGLIETLKLEKIKLIRGLGKLSIRSDWYGIIEKEETNK